MISRGVASHLQTQGFIEQPESEYVPSFCDFLRRLDDNQLARALEHLLQLQTCSQRWRDAAVQGLLREENWFLQAHFSDYTDFELCLYPERNGPHLLSLGTKHVFTSDEAVGRDLSRAVLHLEGIFTRRTETLFCPEEHSYFSSDGETIHHAAFMVYKTGTHGPFLSCQFFKKQSGCRGKRNYSDVLVRHV